MRIDILIGHASFLHQISRDNFLHYFNKGEIKHYDQFHFVSDKESYTLNRILLKTALKRYQPDVSLQSWQFSTYKYGKPFIVFPQLTRKIFFNLSRIINTIAVAIGSHYELGVNIEQVRNLGNSYLSISQYFFTPQETTSIASLPHYEDQLLFWKMRALREIYIRYRGKGLSLGLNCIESHLTDKKLASKYRGSPACFPQWKICNSFLALASPLITPKITIELSPMQSQPYYRDYQLIHPSNG